MTRPDWHTRAACRGADPDTFHPQRGAGSGRLTRQAKAICATCPVRNTCLLDHITRHPTSNELDLGVWGGTTPRARRALRHDPVGLLFVQLRAELEVAA